METESALIRPKEIQECMLNTAAPGQKYSALYIVFAPGNLLSTYIPAAL
jgi:hypothetical protein